MIRALVREQLRARPTSTVWTAVLLSLAVALAAAGMIAAATQVELDLRTEEVRYGTYENYAFIYLDASEEASAPPGETLTPIADFEATMNAAAAEGHDVRASLHPDLVVRLPPGSPLPYDYWRGAQARHPDPDWDDIVIEGEAPTRGEIVVDAGMAELAEADIGDSISLMDSADPGTAVAPSMRISGLSASSTMSVFQTWPPAIYLTWEDAVHLSALEIQRSDRALEPVYVSVRVAWQDGVPMMDTWLPHSYSDGLFLEQSSLPLLNGWSWAAIGIAVVVVIAMIAATLATGRSQAQARTHWLATVQVLGTRKRTVAAASALEALMVGAVAVAVGLVVGWLIVVAALALARAAAPTAVLPTTPSMPWLAVALVIALGFGLAAITSMVPAFWASQVSASAALKPVHPLSDAQVSRTVSNRWLVGLAAACLVAAAAARIASSQDWGRTSSVLGILAAVIAVPVAVAGVVEVSRLLMARIGRRLSRGASPSSVAAGAMMVTHARTIAAAMAIVVLAAGAMVATWGLGIFNMAPLLEDPQYGPGLLWESLFPSAGVTTAVIAGHALTAVVAAVVVTSALRSNRADLQVQMVLGLDSDDARRARRIVMAYPLVAGILGGGLFGWLSLSAVFMVTGALGEVTAVSTYLTAMWQVAIAMGFTWVFAVPAIALVVAAVSARKPVLRIADLAAAARS